MCVQWTMPIFLLGENSPARLVLAHSIARRGMGREEAQFQFSVRKTQRV